MIESSLGNISGAVLATEPTLPPIRAAGYEYVVAANGLFIRAEDSRMEAMAPVCLAEEPLHGLAAVEPYARLRLSRIKGAWLDSTLRDAAAQRRRSGMPNEIMWQFVHGFVTVRGSMRGGHYWQCWRPRQEACRVRVDYDDMGSAVVDLHSHNSMQAFWSHTDNQDERGLRFYAVIGRLDTDRPEIRCRVGVYGHHWPVPATTIFESAGPFVDLEEDANVAIQSV